MTVLEASAGTGKTFTIAALAARYVAEGTPLDQLLLVTFTRMATGELRERVRERLVSAEHGARARAGRRADPVGRRGRAAARRRARPTRSRCAASGSRAALADFDAATIATTHGFCQEVLGGLGIAGDVEPDTTFVEDIADLLEEVVDDLYVRRFRGARRRRSAAREALADRPDGDRQPGGADRAGRRARRQRSRRCASGLAGAVARGARGRKRRAGVLTYDDLLTRLRRHARARRRGRRRAAARALPRRARRRVPGHRPGPVGDHARARSATATRRSC